jgi:TldD protein
MIEKDLKRYVGHFKGYTELRLQKSVNTNIVLLNGNLTLNNNATSAGVFARVYNQGYWGGASLPGMDKDNIKTVISRATESARFLSSRSVLKFSSLPVERTAGSHCLAPAVRFPDKDIIQFMRTMDDYIASRYKDIKSRRFWFTRQDVEKSLITSDGTEYYSHIPLYRFMLSMVYEKNGESADMYRMFGGCGFGEDIASPTSNLAAIIDETVCHLAKKCEGVFPEAGTKQCLLASNLTGMLAHEAIGHTVEADLVQGGSLAAQNLNKQVASELVTLVDYANTAGGVMCPAPVYVDDEGTKAEDVVLIEKGILKGYMHDKQSALHFGVKPTGNARAGTFSDEPLIRMRNTAILPGKDKLEDMLASIDDGYFLMENGNGQAELTSEFMFAVQLGYEIKKGKLGRAIKNTSVSGLAYDVLKSVDMVSDTMRWRRGGMCGKVQPLFAGIGGPAVKCKICVGGR